MSEQNTQESIDASVPPLAGSRRLIAGALEDQKNCYITRGVTPPQADKIMAYFIDLSGLNQKPICIDSRLPAATKKKLMSHSLPGFLQISEEDFGKEVTTTQKYGDEVIQEVTFSKIPSSARILLLCEKEFIDVEATPRALLNIINKTVAHSSSPPRILSLLEKKEEQKAPALSLAKQSEMDEYVVALARKGNDYILTAALSPAQMPAILSAVQTEPKAKDGKVQIDSRALPKVTATIRNSMPGASFTVADFGDTCIVDKDGLAMEVVSYTDLPSGYETLLLCATNLFRTNPNLFVDRLSVSTPYVKIPSNFDMVRLKQCVKSFPNLMYALSSKMTVEQAIACVQNTENCAIGFKGFPKWSKADFLQFAQALSQKNEIIIFCTPRVEKTKEMIEWLVPSISRSCKLSVIGAGWFEMHKHVKNVRKKLPSESNHALSISTHSHTSGSSRSYACSPITTAPPQFSSSSSTTTEPREPVIANTWAHLFSESAAALISSTSETQNSVLGGPVPTDGQTTASFATGLSLSKEK